MFFITKSVDVQRKISKRFCAIRTAITPIRDAYYVTRIVGEDKEGKKHLDNLNLPRLYVVAEVAMLPDENATGDDEKQVRVSGLRDGVGCITAPL